MAPFLNGINVSTLTDTLIPKGLTPDRGVCPQTEKCSVPTKFLDWIALVTSHIPNSHGRTVRYYGRYSNVSRGKRRKQATGVSKKHRIENSWLSKIIGD